MTTATHKARLAMLTSYRTGQHERKLVAERLGPAQVRVFDAPQHADGETYIVEALDLEIDGAGALSALVTEYLAHAAKLEDIPMATSLLRDYLDSPTAEQAS